MSTSPPSPLQPRGRLAGLWTRARLTLQYHGPGELAFRIVTAPLRLTPLAPRLRSAGRFDGRRIRRMQQIQESRAYRWYRAQGRPVTVVIPTYGDPSLVEQAVRSIRKTCDMGRTRIVV